MHRKPYKTLPTWDRIAREGKELVHATYAFSPNQIKLLINNSTLSVHCEFEYDIIIKSNSENLVNG